MCVQKGLIQTTHKLIVFGFGLSKKWTKMSSKSNKQEELKFNWYCQEINGYRFNSKYCWVRLQTQYLNKNVQILIVKSQRKKYKANQHDNHDSDIYPLNKRHVNQLNMFVCSIEEQTTGVLLFQQHRTKQNSSLKHMDNKLKIKIISNDDNIEILILLKKLRSTIDIDIDTNTNIFCYIYPLLGYCFYLPLFAINQIELFLFFLLLFSQNSTPLLMFACIKFAVVCCYLCFIYPGFIRLRQKQFSDQINQSNIIESKKYDKTQ